ncbi:MAG TPA: pirin family protein [Aliidongia sp.]|uniref:pirin family protein n=1 Tax=Aliidongia sp. TaxID=1914230 RepID=UPI002DDDB4E8|nr:pirin family protein [Aliidongia sp.]HEV2674442.1 pirin family protein [Aliidongia sp.]
MSGLLEPDGPVEMVILGRARDLGGFEVRRVLPFAQRRMVGPFIFLDQMGPVDFAASAGLDVRAHPHIGLSTVTYLFDGELTHRDSLGTEQVIRPGDVNWMTAGSGIAHSERTPAALRPGGTRLYGIQSWVALPAAVEERTPHFAHHGKTALPVVEGEGLRVRLIAGALYGARSPVATASDLFHADVAMEPGARLDIPADWIERAAYLVSGAVTIEGQAFEAGQMMVLKPDARIMVVAIATSRLMLLGGEPLEGPRYIWWNFVSSSKDRLETAKADWRGGRFGAVPGESDPLPLPE